MQHSTLRNRYAALGSVTLAALGLAAPHPTQAQGYTLQTLASFNGSNGWDPQAGLTLSADGNTLYGTTDLGGIGNNGVVFSIPVGGGTPTDLAVFGVGGNSGSGPQAGLTLSADGKILFGTTYNGGNLDQTYGGFGDGTVFSVPVSGGTPTTLATFNGTNGAKPLASITLSADGNSLYGTTYRGGSVGVGTVFSVPVVGGTPTTLATFSGDNGSSPQAGLTLIGSRLYGTTSGGGNSPANGVVFSVPASGGAPIILAQFTGANGYQPMAGLTLSADGKTFYGTTETGGSNGTVFSLPISGGTPTTLATFNGSNGTRPYAGVTLSTDGKTLFGTTHYGGGPSYDGTVFSVPVGGGTPTVLATFTGANGSLPSAGLTLGPNGILYGTTETGGAGGFGTIFALVPPSATSQSHPILPSSTSTSGGVTTFTFSQVASGSWVDPANATCFVFTMTGGSLFTGITGFPTGFTSPFDVTANGKDYGLFTPGKALAFDGLGVSSFLISGINPSVDGASPTAFPLQLTFNTLNADFTMTAAPEPPSVAALSLGALGLGGLALRARRKVKD